MRTTTAQLRWLALTALVLAAPAQAVQLMQATLTGTIGGGSDAYLNTVYFGPTLGNNLAGLDASITIVYDADLARPNVPNNAPNWYFAHDPGYPSFVGVVGQSPLVAASFTVNGYTIDLDVAGSYEKALLQVNNPPGGSFDSFLLAGGDERRQWCINDAQCAERVSISAYQPGGDDLFGGPANFDPANPFSVLAAPGRQLEGSVRMIQSTVCLAGGIYAGVCPEGRFNDGATHWVEFVMAGSSLTVAAVSAVPEPQTWAMLLAGLGLLGACRRPKGRVASS